MIDITYSSMMAFQIKQRGTVPDRAGHPVHVPPAVLRAGGHHVAGAAEEAVGYFTRRQRAVVPGCAGTPHL